MKYWIVPSNDNIFRIGDAIAAQGGLVDWRNDRFSVGDIVYIYKTKPEQCIRYRMEVVKVKLAFDHVFEQEPFWTDKDTYYSGIMSEYARLRLVEEYPDDRLSLSQMQEHGYNGVPQGVRECKNMNLLNFLQNPYPSTMMVGETPGVYGKNVRDDSCEIDYREGDGFLYEGALVEVLANKYERNAKARKECVKRKGYKCLVCGCDFEAVYGEIGKDFIHVHHVVPISSIGKEYKLNVDTDLVPVCPNCHYMLHRKNPPYTVEEMKRIVGKVATKNS